MCVVKFNIENRSTCVALNLDHDDREARTEGSASDLKDDDDLNAEEDDLTNFVKESQFVQTAPHPHHTIHIQQQQYNQLQIKVLFFLTPRKHILEWSHVPDHSSSSHLSCQNLNTSRTPFTVHHTYPIKVVFCPSSCFIIPQFLQDGAVPDQSSTMAGSFCEFLRCLCQCPQVITWPQSLVINIVITLPSTVSQVNQDQGLPSYQTEEGSLHRYIHAFICKDNIFYHFVLSPLTTKNFAI